MSNTETKLVLQEQEDELNALLSTHVDQWVKLTNLLYAYPKIKPITRKEIILNLNTAKEVYVCKTPYLFFDFKIGKSNSGRDTLKINVTLTDTDECFTLEHLTDYHDYSVMSGVDREYLTELLAYMTETLKAYTALYRKISPWLALRNLWENTVYKEIKPEEWVSYDSERDDNN